MKPTKRILNPERSGPVIRDITFKHRERLDCLLVERSLVLSREKAQRLIYAGHVRVNGQVLAKPGHRVERKAQIDIDAREQFVGRGGKKLDHAVKFFNLNVQGVVCLDIGASTGGFTDCMLQHGALKVYAVDVGYGQLAWKLRNDSRVVVMERINARYLRPEDLPEQAWFVTIDVSFISLTKILPSVKNIVCSGATIITLIKPQFEAPRSDVGRGGVIRNPDVWNRVLDHIRCFGVNELGFEWVAVCKSPIKGAAGNTEFLAYWRKP